MPEENLDHIAPKMEITQAPGGIAKIYANHIQIGATGYDVNIWCSHLVRLTNANPTDQPVNQIEQRGMVSMAWSEAKFLRDALSKAIARFEEINGEINPNPGLPKKLD